MQLGQIGCGRQNPPIQSAELASSRIGMAKGKPSTSLLCGNRMTTQHEIRCSRNAGIRTVRHDYMVNRILTKIDHHRHPRPVDKAEVIGFFPQHLKIWESTKKRAKS
ncbi:Hypothetical_protein [Hexamita inflata]|uniref:Hypothetical_protein n=1 Tax=Hexamita inflata TaxID=28002 RepID=A0ABP1HNI6_9EUKA